MKRLPTILLFLLLGAVVSVLVAWGCAQLTLSRMTNPAMLSSHHVIWNTHKREGWADAPDYRLRATAFGFVYEELSGRVSFNENTSADTGGSMPRPWIKSIFKEWRLGWPAPCLRRRLWLAMGQKIPSDYVYEGGGVEGELLLPENGLFTLPERRLPIDPVWTGLIFNTVFFAGVLWLLVLSAVWLRGYLRHKRGLCVKCAYDLRGAEHEACPECGEQVAHPSPIEPLGTCSRHTDEPARNTSFNSSSRDRKVSRRFRTKLVFVDGHATLLRKNAEIYS